MSLTNRTGMPEHIFKVLQRLVARDPYTKGDAHLSVTELIDSPRVRALRRKHAAEMSRDAADSIWSFVGKALHDLLEQGAADGQVAEVRLFAEVNGVKVSGAIDLRAEAQGMTINDWKFTSTWSVREEKVEWVRQFNKYAYLAEREGLGVTTGLTVTAFLRDWSRRLAERDAAYPQAPIVVVDIPLWTFAEREQYVQERVEAHLHAQRCVDFDDPLPPCSDDERWLRPGKFAVMKKGNKRAVKLCDDRIEAEAHLPFPDEPDAKKYYVEERPSLPVRCEQNYCQVAQYCDFYQKEKKGE